MEDQLYSKAKEELRYLDKVHSGLEKRLRNAPAGTLSIRTGRDGNVQFYKLEHDQKSYIPVRDMATKRKLAQKEYDKRAIRLAERKAKSLQRFTRQYPEQSLQQVWGTMHLAKREYVVPVVLTDEEYAKRWQAVEYQGKVFYEDDLTQYYTHRGERVRSKSEIIIADMLDSFNIPYRYEFPHTLGNRTRPIYADFTVLNVRTRKEYIWEHLGRMSDPEYAGDSIWKLSVYLENGYYMGENLLFTMESQEHPLKTQDVREIIEHYLL